MKNAKIVLVAQWDGWCGACGADRPLVLTRTGRQRLRTWLTGAADDSRPLVLTCRLCGTGVTVPLEQDDPPVELSADPPDPATAPLVPGVELEAVDVDASTAALEGPTATPAPEAQLAAGRQAVARVLGGLLAQRQTTATVAQLTPFAGLLPAPVPVLPGAAPLPDAAVLPQQRSAPTGGLTELQLLADGLDLLSTGRV